MSSKRARGFTLLEMILAIVIIGIAVAGLMSAFSNSLVKSADPIVRKQLMVIAEEIMEEIQLKPYVSSQTKTTSGCARSGFYKVADYNGYSTAGSICDVDGNSITSLSGYSLSITVSTTTLSGVAETQIIVVTVSRGSESIALKGWRTNYAS